MEIQARETESDGYVVFLCNFERLDSEDFHYHTEWFVNDKHVISKKAQWSETYVESSKLTEYHLEQAGFHKFGFDVRLLTVVYDDVISHSLKSYSLNVSKFDYILTGNSKVSN